MTPSGESRQARFRGESNRNSLLSRCSLDGKLTIAFGVPPTMNHCIQHCLTPRGATFRTIGACGIDNIPAELLRYATL